MRYLTLMFFQSFPSIMIKVFIHVVGKAGTRGMFTWLLSLIQGPSVPLAREKASGTSNGLISLHQDPISNWGRMHIVN